MSGYTPELIGNLRKASDAGFVEEHFRVHLKRLYGVDVEAGGVSVERVFPGPEGSFVLQYRVRIRSENSGSGRDPLWCGLLPAESTALPTWAQSESSKGFSVESVRMAVPAFPFDPDLPQIADFWRAGHAASYVQRGCLPDTVPKPLDRTPLVLAYRLGRRCTLYFKCASSETDSGARETGLIFKLVRHKSLPRIQKALEALQPLDPGHDSEDHLTIPRVHYTDSDTGVVVMEAAPGATLHDLTTGALFTRAAESAGRILARLHALPPAGLESVDVGTELGSLEKWIRVLCAVHKSDTERANKVMKRLETGADVIERQYAPTLTHGDFFDKQVLYTPERTTLVDWDGIVAGDPARDYGNFMAHLGLRALQQPSRSREIKSAMVAFQTAYGNHDTVFAARVRWWASASRLRLAALYGLRPRWRHLVPVLLEDALVKVERTVGLETL